MGPVPACQSRSDPECQRLCCTSWRWRCFSYNLRVPLPPAERVVATGAGWMCHHPSGNTGHVWAALTQHSRQLQWCRYVKKHRQLENTLWSFLDESQQKGRRHQKTGGSEQEHYWSKVSYLELWRVCDFEWSKKKTVRIFSCSWQQLLNSPEPCVHEGLSRSWVMASSFFETFHHLVTCPHPSLLGVGDTGD